MSNPFGDTKFERHPSGAIIVDGIEVAHTMQCCHCGVHFVSVKGSGKVRGFCLKCHKVTCGAMKCNPCVTVEENLARIEAGIYA